jgi:hypothetical protein
LKLTIDLRSNVDSVIFTADGSWVVVSYRDGRVYVIDPRLPPAASDTTTTIAARDMINFICDEPLKSGFWMPQDDADLTGILQGAEPQACGTSRL